jgi:putative ABC transport system ATP-binding protein
MIQVRDLRKTYHVGEVDVHALRGVNLDVAQGEFLAVVGPSGSGKSTLFHILGGLAAPTSGQVLIGGVDLRHMKESERTEMRQKKVGFVFQKYNLLPTLSAGDNISLAQDIAHIKTRPADFDQTLELLGIRNRLQHKPRALSGGEQQRVAIARALVNQPALLLADEPTGNLDTATGDLVLNLLRKSAHEFGVAVLMATHSAESTAVTDRVVKMRDGRVDNA